ncbi:DUF1127 domain-containing protein [Pseudomonas sp. Gutcm_11s]|uniref:DUF1127 domain-containing protein n=1 Tax=Pseudomonas sp. Gutcm_11s TaxID=3026088 RepID=UPI00235F8DC5|nr:DUF1127 domain-containing protein [Pseudomonas sp. Gutcm_11s]MDD0842363.1 DUF1127 domain-containing protein [Pseudomonas sp. Gutcm_11s]
MTRATEQQCLPSAEPRQGGALVGVLRLLGRWSAFQRRLSTRKALLRLSDAQLSDIGLNRAEALAEAERPLWTLWREAE